MVFCLCCPNTAGGGYLVLLITWSTKHVRWWSVKQELKDGSIVENNLNVCYLIFLMQQYHYNVLGQCCT